ncbi:MAG: D-hexose-6-phosphate mutarotase [Hydrogenophaga sp.]|uniref:D-hexose-6-phosphate mutarotase n=1 Tax=Hydrogenophaga sp. TaxID=1904254 RepID=UPI001D47B30F|nr:D-hexose-6-phosphate mutarotase [Hydrogenophaga sp.]MBX3609007.1 D-hexose-6-phosphate mutarotase [Hydrogenophaga sp.]
MPTQPDVHCFDGPGGLPMVRVHGERAQALISLQGAQVLGHQPLGGVDTLFTSPLAQYAPGRPIRGGVPVCWPWFGPDPLNQGRPAHGFARTRLWTLREATQAPDGDATVVFDLQDDETSRALWPHPFALSLAITIGAGLRLALRTHNPGSAPMTLTQALHSYFAVSDVAAVRVLGLEGCRYDDRVAGPTSPLPVQTGELHFAGQVDRVYQNVPAALTIEDPRAGRRLRLVSQGSRTAVVWNPGTALAATMADLGAEASRAYVCVETANAGDELITLAPGASHTLAVAITPEAL